IKEGDAALNQTKQYIAILSLGQLLNSNNMSIVDAIKNYIDTKYRAEGVVNNIIGIGSLIYSRVVFGIEVVFPNTVTKRFNIGQATWEELFDYIKKWSFDYGHEITEDEAKELWNSVCVGKGGYVEKNIKDNINSLVEFLRENPNLTLIIPSN